MNFISVETYSSKSSILELQQNKALLSNFNSVIDRVKEKSIVLENEMIKINFDNITYLPNNIEFKKLNQSINLKMEIVRYPT